LSEDKSGKHRWTDPVVLVPIITAVIAAIPTYVLLIRPAIEDIQSPTPEPTPTPPKTNATSPLEQLGQKLADPESSTTPTPTPETTTTTQSDTAGISAESTVVMPLGSSASTINAGYEPAAITVSPGAKVVWDNQDNALHTATSGESPSRDGKFDTGLVGANRESIPVTMPNEPGEYRYFCTLHPFLVGTITVQ
jgi:plastocyanin